MAGSSSDTEGSAYHQPCTNDILARVAGTHRRRTPRNAHWGLVAALRLIVLSLAVQTGGVARDAADVVSAIVLGVDAPDLDDDCLRDHGNCHCPPGCPNCHCSHGVASLPPRAADPLLSIVPDATELVALGKAGRGPPRPVLDGVYRPPRSTHHLA
jgi:hypothetical protein